jgi:ornithine cyclodeaminase
MMEIVTKKAEALLHWHSLTEALMAGHRLPKAEIADMLLYRGKDTLLNRAAWIDGLGQLVKCATIFPGNAAANLPSVNGSVTLYSDTTGEPMALVDFHLVTKWKTAGDSLLSAKLLARPDSRKILLVGAGTVAHSMVQAYSSIFPDAEFTVWNRTPATAKAMEGPRITAVQDLQSAVANADIICTATMATQPLIKGEWLQPGQHLDLIGAYTPAMREVDDEAIRRARVFVDARATTVHHIGELIAPLASGALLETDIQADFYDIGSGAYARRSTEEITIAKNGGGAHLDLMTASYILAAWQAR